MIEDQERDPDVREWFEVARRVEMVRTPSFQRVRAGRVRQRPRGRSRWVLAAAVMAVVALVAVRLAIRSGESPDWATVASAHLRTQTDFLLEVNGAEFLSSVPSIGKADGWFPKLEVSKDNRL